MYHKIKNTFIFLSLLFLFSFKHPYYLSVCDLKYSVTEKAIQGSVKIFINDLENALKKKQSTTVDLINNKDKSKTNEILCDYLKNHLKINMDGHEINYTCLGSEVEEEVIWIYIETKKCANPKRVRIENSILYDDITSQSNIVHFESNGIQKSSKVNYPDKFLEFEF